MQNENYLYFGKKYLYITVFTIHPLFLFNVQAMDIVEEQKSPETPPITPILVPNLAPVNNRKLFTKKNQKELEQELGEAIAKQDTATIIRLINTGIPINKQITCEVYYKKEKKEFRLYRPLVLAFIYADKNNFDAVETLLTLGADMQFLRKPHCYIDKEIEAKVKRYLPY